MASAEKELADLLRSLFDAGELRRFVREGPQGDTVADELPGETVSLTELADEAARKLRKAGLCDEAFFDRLVEAKPLRKADIDAVRRRFGAQAGPPAAATSPLYGVPEGTQFFTGREEDLTKLATLLRGDDVTVSAAIEGLPGVGKSELAIRLAHVLARAGEFPAGIYWLDAEAGDLRSSWDRIGSTLGLEGTPDRPERAVRHVHDAQGRALLVLDNVETWKPRPAPLPEGSHIRRLVTTRRRDLGGVAFRHHPLEVLPPTAARALFDRIAEREVADADDLLEYLGGHTLAVELAASWLREPGTTARAHLSRLRAGADPTDEIDERGRYELTVRQGLTALWGRLGEEDRLAWATVAALAPGSVSEGLLDACGVTSERRRGLHRWFLLRPEGEGRWGLHRLVRQFGATQSVAGAEDAAFAGALMRARAMDVATGQAVYLPDAAHYDHLVDRTEGRPGFAPSDCVHLADRVATARQAAGDLSGARSLFERALRLMEGSDTAEADLVGSLQSNLAVALRALGDFEGAKKHLEASLKTRAPDDPHIAITKSNLATVLQDLGDFEGARQHLEGALASDLSRYGPDHPNVALCHSNLAVLDEAVGDLPGAERHIEAALSTMLKARGPDHPHVATLRSNLAAVLHRQGDSETAAGLLQVALASDLRNYGPDHPNVAVRRSNLAIVQRDAGRSDAARHEALEARRIAVLQPPGSRIREGVLHVTRWLDEGG